MMAKFFVSVGGLVFLLFLGSGAAFNADYTAVCFNAHVQDAPLILLYGSSLVTSLEIKTISDTTATKKRFHVDYMHPKNPKWTSYQEDRLTKIYFLPSEHDRRVTKFVFSDPFVAEFLRVSLFEGDSMGWLGEICVNIQFKINKKVKHPMGEGSCAKGFYGDGKYCVDINECADVTGNFCPRKQHCKDVPGSYSCLGTCIGDLLPHKKTKECQDPCFRDGLVCHKKARCWKGECVCNTGFEGDGLYCLDKCTADSLTCDRNAYCEKGNCVCRSGYEGNGAVCQAICGFRRHLCHPNAECRRNNCKCKPGFVGNGISKCVFSRALYEKAKKEETTVPRMDIVETDIFEVLHTFQRVHSIFNDED